MKNQKHLAARIGAVAAATALMAASAFADSRPADETRSGRIDRGKVQRDAMGAGAVTRLGNESSNRARQSRGANDSYRGRSNDSRRDGNDSRRDGNWRNDGRSSSARRGNDHREPFYARGKVSRVVPYGAGYRVWVGGARHPFYVPRAHYHRDRFRVGVVINLGGYYNPAGYYDYYDGRGRSSGQLRGIVESTDYRRDTFVIRNDATGSFVTVVMRDRRGHVRAGDYVELYGDWNRSGIFQAYDVDLLDRGYRR